MQFSLKNLKSWGYRKIHFSLGLGDLDSELLSSISNFNVIWGGIDDSAYSFPNNWSSVDDDLNIDQYYAFKMLLDYVGDDILEKIPSATSRSRFRYTWNSLWAEYGKLVSSEEKGFICYDYEVNLFSSVGIRFALCPDDVRNLDVNIDILRFLNSVISWYLVTKTLDNNTPEKGYLELIDDLVVNDGEDFINDTLPSLVL